jgi:hypothetical protein
MAVPHEDVDEPRNALVSVCRNVPAVVGYPSCFSDIYIASYRLD